MAKWTMYPVTHGYITEYEGPGTDTPHYAEDIATPQDTPLTAILPGIVEKADYQPWGGEIFIKPDDSRYPEYYMYHTDLNEVSAGQHVAAGQEIALSGGQTSGGRHPVTDGESTGPHVHLGWFSKYITPSQTGYTIPYGPDPTDLLALAEGSGSAASPANAKLADSSTCQIPSGLDTINPSAWASYWGCVAGHAAAGSAEQSVGGIAGWLGASAGPFMLRMGVGAGGLMLIWLGLSEIVDALKGGQSSGSGARKATKQKKEPAKKEPAKKEPAKKEPAKKEPAKKEPAKKEGKGASPKTAKAGKAESAGEASGGAGSAGAAEAAAAVA